uniref:Uncharacterized protein n=1 Tax=Rhizophagus irregularis (strain DAOM 181602 / DAOM 197198 / MUCL 43194) TaxID=747089 RepID=U9UCV4_RHIID
MILLSDRTCDYYFALCVVLLITFQFWYGAPHISFYENTEEMSKVNKYTGRIYWWNILTYWWLIYSLTKSFYYSLIYTLVHLLCLPDGPYTCVLKKNE